MRRRVLHFTLIASVLGSLCVWGAVLSMGPRVRAREASDELVVRAQELAAEGDRVASRELVEEALVVDESNPRARRELAMHVIAKGDYKAAAEELRRIATEQGEDSGAARELAALLSLMGDEEGAVDWSREAVKRDPRSGLAYVGLSHCLMEIGSAEAGLRAAEEAVALSPRMHSARLVLGWARWQSRDLAGSREAFDEAAQLRPSDVTALLAAAAVSSELGLGDSAIGYARRAVTVDGQSARAWLILARVLAATGQSAAADEALARARSLDAARSGVPEDSSQQAGTAFPREESGPAR